MGNASNVLNEGGSSDKETPVSAEKAQEIGLAKDDGGRTKAVLELSDAIRTKLLEVANGQAIPFESIDSLAKTLANTVADTIDAAIA